MTPSHRPRGRFAPSPTGPLHFGSLVAALGSWMDARRAGGDWLLRIEDIDPPREVPGAAARQLATLQAFGFEADAPPLYQHARGDAYAAALARLLKDGLAFECRCSRRDLEASGGIHHACVPSPPDRPAAVRLRVPAGVVAFDDAVQGHVAQDVHADVGDVVLHRADGFWAYQLAVVVDDAWQGITSVVRGADLLDSTPRQILLQRALGLPTPTYAHLPLATGPDGQKLSKSLAALPVDDDAPMPALHAAWTFLGQPPAAMPRHGAPAAALASALPHYDPTRIPRAPQRPATLDTAPA